MKVLAEFFTIQEAIDFLDARNDGDSIVSRDIFTGMYQVLEVA